MTEAAFAPTTKSDEAPNCPICPAGKMRALKAEFRERRTRWFPYEKGESYMRVTYECVVCRCRVTRDIG